MRFYWGGRHKPCFSGGAYHHQIWSLDDFRGIYSRLSVQVFPYFASCGEANATLIHTCLQELWQLRDRIARVIWFRGDLFIGSRLAKRVFKPSTE